MKNLIIKSLLTLTLLSVFAFVPKLALAATAPLDCARADLSAKEEIQCGSCQAAGNEASCTPADAPKTVTDTAKTVINVLSVLAGAAAVVMIIVGGFRYVTSAGNAESTKSARNTIVYAVVGLIIVALAQIIVHFVLDNVSTTSSTTAASQTSGQAGTSGEPNTSAARQ